jgi:hypothetical protein
VAFELAAAVLERILSLTLLNTIVEVDRFERPWVIEPFVVVRGTRGCSSGYACADVRGKVCRAPVVSWLR